MYRDRSSLVWFAIGLVITFLLFWALGIGRVASQELYPHFSLIEDGTTLQIDEVTEEELSRVDSYLRLVEGDPYEWPHVLVIVPDGSYFDMWIGDLANGLDLSRASGLTTSVNWNFDRMERGDAFVDQATWISLARQFDDDATMFGLIVHELSHAVHTRHGNGTALGDANYWERIARNAYNQNCGTNIYCLDLETIIYQ